METRREAWGGPWREEGGFRLRLAIGALTALAGAALGALTGVAAESGPEEMRRLALVCGLAGFASGIALSGGFGREGRRGWLRALLSFPLAILFGAQFVGVGFAGLLGLGFYGGLPGLSGGLPLALGMFSVALIFGPASAWPLLKGLGAEGAAIALGIWLILQILAIRARRSLGPPARGSGFSVGNAAFPKRPWRDRPRPPPRSPRRP